MAIEARTVGTRKINRVAGFLHAGSIPALITKMQLRYGRRDGKA
jgi:hypothetical protein